jgi:predicted porin
MISSKWVMLAVVLLSVSRGALCQTEGATWASVTVQKKLSEKFEISLQPELRWTDTELERRMLETEVEYSPMKFFSTAITHRYTLESTNNGQIEYHRMAIDLNGQFKLSNWEPELRLRYTNIKDFNADGGANFLRYKAGMGYNIPKFKGTPEVSVEAFQEMDGKTIRKMRYSIGGRYKISKAHSLALAYKRDDFKTKQKFVNIMDVGYRYKF